ncbi:MAG: 30S ribosome-binding factor RbfA [Candidatus Wildermuthbacteria bacterium]|nr:30S ribosome-binding factor RbfA [Candidatus Wildermuthbacteria bacterium]
MGKKRILRVNELLRKELARILLEDLELPQGSLLTLVQADASPDLQHAKIYVTILPEGRSKEILGILEKSIFDIQQRLNKRLVMRPIPKIQFVRI